ncbi:MAG: AraC family transcriptional regulator [Pseudopedobacter saltans]|uniref:AraC family transcriptional regulator n=1 Tax=Pseudopedobacter saltans TaxID=151895 RepID=A0A2W5EWU9_9SPHI|nr:MAG: AraC family transcriptional regulator [Pseudopedobacter saltans]
MVCDRCVMVVEDVLKNQHIEFNKITLGNVTLQKQLTNEEKEKLSTKLESLGFELLQSKKNVLVEKIKNLIIQQIQYSTEQIPVNLSTYLSSQLHADYSSLSNTFSQEENITIEQFTILQKTEKIKELLSYGEKTLTEIADQMGYASVAYLSTQFKKQTGLSPSQYKSSSALRKPLDKV